MAPLAPTQGAEFFKGHLLSRNGRHLLVTARPLAGGTDMVVNIRRGIEQPRTLVDLTAIPIRSFSMLLVQRMMRTPEMLNRWRLRLGIEGAIFAISTLALAALALTLVYYPTLLGSNVAQAAPLVILALAVPGLRNLTEYQADLLFARGQTFIRAVNLAVLATAKAALLSLVLKSFHEASDIVLSLNAVFAVLYLLSMVLTYRALARPARRV